MRHDLKLIPLDPSAAAIAFTLDDESLEVPGPDASLVLELLRAAAAVGHVVIHPYPTMVETPAPERDRGQFAAVLADQYHLSELLAAWLPLEAERASGEARILY